IDPITLEFIELIAYLNTTCVIYNHTYDINPKYGYNSNDDKNNVSKLRILIKNDTYNMKQALNGQRQVLKNNSFILNMSLLEYFKGEEIINQRPEVSVITSTNRKENLDFYINQMNQQKEMNIEINLVTHG